MSETKFGLLGHNIGYSRSHDIFMAIFEHTGTKGSFENFDLEPDSFEAGFAEIKERQGLAGLSVTIPFKHRVIRLLDELHPVAETLQAVNSIAFQENRLIGFNTDRDGFGYPLKAYSSRLKHRRGAVLGCGGSARAAVYALHADYELDEIVVFGRSRENLNAFAGAFEESFDHLKVTPKLILSLADFDSESLSIIVNCTPLGGWNQPDRSPFPDGFSWPRGRIYYDLNYNRANRLLEQASSAGMIAIDGSHMLTAQALKSYEIWTTRAIPFEPIHSAVFGAS